MPTPCLGVRRSLMRTSPPFLAYGLQRSLMRTLQPSGSQQLVGPSPPVDCRLRVRRHRCKDAGRRWTADITSIDVARFCDRRRRFSHACRPARCWLRCVPASPIYMRSAVGGSQVALDPKPHCRGVPGSGRRCQGGLVDVHGWASRAWYAWSVCMARHAWLACMAWFSVAVTQRPS